MTDYTHPQTDGLYGRRPFELALEVNGETDLVKFPRGWLDTATEQEIADIGFVKYVPPEPNPLTVDQRRTQAIADLKALRYDKEVGGIDVTISTGSVPVSTNRGDDRNNLHIQLTAITNVMRADPSTFNLADSMPRQISNADMMTIIQAALAYVQACFDREDVVTDALDAATTHAAMDDAVDIIDTGWPATSY